MKTRSLGSHPGRTADPSASPDFLVDLVGVDGLHAVFSYGKPHTRLCPVQRGRKSRFARDDKFKFDTFVGLRDTDGKTPFDRSSTAHSAVPIALVNGSAPLPLVIPRIHKKVLMVVVLKQIAGRAEDFQRRRFGTAASELQRLTAWLREQGVEEAVMESTAQYWKPVWYELEPHMRLQLAQAFSNRAPRGRKQDFRDAERLVRRLLAEELILSFVPQPEQRAWRMMTRAKVQLARDRVRLHNQLEGLLEEMRIKLSSVLSDLLGVSGLRILRALANRYSALTGWRLDPMRLTVERNSVRCR